MKTKVIFTTHFVGHREYVFDDRTMIDSECVHALSTYGVFDCRRIVDGDVEIIAINERAACACDLFERVNGILSYFCPSGEDEVFLILHSRTDLPLQSYQRQPIGEFRGWSNTLTKYQRIRIWAMAHDVDNDKCSYILTKNAYKGESVCARAILDRIRSVFDAEDISHLWSQYRKNQTQDNLNLLVQSINSFQHYSFIVPIIDLELFKKSAPTIQFGMIKRLTNKNPIIFKSHGSNTAK